MSEPNRRRVETGGQSRSAIAGFSPQTSHPVAIQLQTISLNVVMGELNKMLKRIIGEPIDLQ
jgi:hypothetical protein